MSRVAAIGAQVLFTALGVVVGGFILFVLKGGIGYLPQFEGTLMPTVAASVAEASVTRDNLKTCFALQLKKVREGAPLKYQFFVQAEQNKSWLARTNVDAYLARQDNTRTGNIDFVEHHVGDTWTRHYCFEMPGTVADSQRLRVSGYALHHRHAGWDVETPIPDFYVRPLH